MFHVLLLNLLVFGAMLVVSFLTSSLPGRNPVPARAWHRVQDKDELERQFPNLSPDVYEQFDRAVDSHLNGEFDDARRGYQSLNRAQTLDGKTIDLVNAKGPVQHNLQILKSDSRSLSGR